VAGYIAFRRQISKTIVSFDFGYGGFLVPLTMVPALRIIFRVAQASRRAKSYEFSIGRVELRFARLTFSTSTLPAIVNGDSDKTAQQREEEEIEAKFLEYEDEEEVNEPDTEHKLANVIRNGMALLNQSAAFIQSSAHTRSSILDDSPRDDETPKHLSEEYRLYGAIQQCLEDMVTNGDAALASSSMDPVMILTVKCTPSMQYADIYWALPYSVLTTKNLNEEQRVFLKTVMEERLHGAEGKMLLGKVYSMLRSYYPPKLRFKAASETMVQQVLLDLNFDI
jgi:hypothetical protein